MEFVKDRRLFKRYKHKSDFYIIIESNYFKASTVDFSLSGMCIFIEGMPSIALNSVISLRIEDMDMDIQARVVWIKKTESNLLVGLEKMLISGILKYYALSDILLDLQRSDETGILEFIDGSVVKRIYIKNGVMTFATSNQLEERLEEVLLRSGKLSSDQYYQSIAIMQKEGKKLWKILIELGYLKPQELVWAAKHQVEEIILNLFRWEGGQVKFIEGPLPDEAIALKLSAANLIFQGMKKIKTAEYFKKILPSMDTTLYYSDEPMNLFQDINFAEEDRYVLSLMDSKLTLKEILSISSLGNFQTMKILCALIGTRMIEAREEGILEDKSIVEIIGEPKTAADKTFVRKVEDLYMKFQSTDYYSILGIDKGAGLDKIRKAYYKTAKEFHPDKHFYLESETMRNKLSAIFSYITDAYKSLSDPEERKNMMRA